jgi:tRNA modification GTPase
MNPDELIATLSTVAAPGPRAILRLSGPRAWETLAQVCQPMPPRPTHTAAISLQLVIPNWHRPFPAWAIVAWGPRSATGQDLIELQLPSCRPILDTVLAQFYAHGARPAIPGEFTLRAFLAGKKDLTQAEAVLGVIHAHHPEELQQALEQLAGNVAHPLAALREDLLNLLADLEAGLDFTEEDIQFVSLEESLNRTSAALAQLIHLERKLTTRTRHDRHPRVILTGPPNAGKSQLFNHLLGQDRAIVSPIPGTTRDYLTERLLIQGITVELIDTAGQEDHPDLLRQAAQTQRQHILQTADLRLNCHPADLPAPTTTTSNPQQLNLWTKSDLAMSPPPPGWIAVSTRLPGGLKDLQAALQAHLLNQPPPALATGHARCRGHLAAARTAILEVHRNLREEDPLELAALGLRQALHALGELTGAVHTNDLLDRIFSRFCIGK